MTLSRISILCISLLLLVAPSIVTAEPIQPLSGASYIGMCSSRFPCGEALKNHSGAIGYLADAFGYKCTCVARAMKQEKTKYVRIHIANGTCFPERGRRCAFYDVFHKESISSAERKTLKRDPTIMARYRSRLRAVAKLVEPHTTRITFRYSLCLECPLSNRARGVLRREALRFFPADSIVDSVLTQKCLKGTICERHGDAPKFVKGERCIADLDGISLFDANIEGLNKAAEQCEAIYYWTPGFNLIPSGYTGPFVEPFKRTHAAYAWEWEGLRACLESR